MPPELQPVFNRLREILLKHAGGLLVKDNPPDHFCLEAKPGLATLRAWGGKVKKSNLPVAWVHIGKAYVSYHLMGIYGNTPLLKGMSKDLKARMQGKTCFNFNTFNEALFSELDSLTDQAIAAFKEAGYIEEKGKRKRCQSMIMSSFLREVG